MQQLSFDECPDCVRLKSELAEMRYRFDQLTAGTVPHVTGSVTSAMGAERVAPSAGDMRAQILGLFTVSRPDWTCAEIERATGFAHQSASARVRELVQADLIAFDEGVTRASVLSGVQVRIYRRVFPTSGNIS